VNYQWSSPPDLSLSSI